MPLELTTVPRVPILRTGHFDLESGAADFALEHLAAAANALANDPACLPLRVRLELADQGHLGVDGITAEAAGGQGGPAIGWGDNYAVAGNTLYADLHVPAIVAGSMEWAFPGRSVEGLFGYTTATGQTHDFMATGLLLLGSTWPGVTTLPDFSEVQAEFAADVAAGAIDVPSFATASLGAKVPERAGEALDQSAAVARMAVTGRAPKPTRDQFATAGINVGDLRMRWYAAESSGELEGLPDSYDYYSWYVVEVRANDDGSLAVYVLDESDGREWSFAVTDVTGGQVVFAEPVEVVRPDPVPVSASAPRPRPAIARWNTRAESRVAASSPSTVPNQQEDDSPMNDAQRRALAVSLGLSPDAPEADVHAEAGRRAAEPPADPATPPEAEVTPPVGEPEVPVAEPAAASARVREVDADRLEKLETDAAAGATARAEQISAQRTDAVRAAVADGRITPASAGLTADTNGAWPDGWRADYDRDPDATARALARLEPGKYPGVRTASGRVTQAEQTTNGGSLNRALAASGLGAPTRKVV